jgi:hypothetical protein
VFFLLPGIKVISSPTKTVHRYCTSCKQQYMIYYRSSSEILPEPEAPLLRRAVREEEQVIFPGPRAAGHHLHLLNLSDQYVIFHRQVVYAMFLQTDDKAWFSIQLRFCCYQASFTESPPSPASPSEIAFPPFLHQFTRYNKLQGCI